MSFLGGGTDYPEYYMEHGGRVLGAAIDKYCYLNVRKLPPFFSHKHRIVYSKSENVKTLDEIQHPAVRTVLKHLKIDYGMSIHHDGDIPARSGMGSSSAFTVGLLKSMHALQGTYISKEALTREAIYVEQKLIRENVGSQDQTFAVYGGFNLIEFHKNGEIEVNPIIIPQERMQKFESGLMLYFTGLSRFASEIAEEQVNNTSFNIQKLDRMKSLVEQAVQIIADDKIKLDEFGALLNDTWRLKKQLSSQISNSLIDDIYSKALSAGAIGGKLLGAGGGGFMLFYVPPDKQARVKQELNDYLHVPFKFDFEGSKVIVYQPDN
jgi:D-glycero-alpha-D-manno-heptose-7-phosphate kinase